MNKPYPSISTETSLREKFKLRLNELSIDFKIEENGNHIKIDFLQPVSDSVLTQIITSVNKK